MILSFQSGEDLDFWFSALKTEALYSSLTLVSTCNSVLVKTQNINIVNIFMK